MTLDMGYAPISHWGLKRATWRLKFCWFPRRCFLTNRRLWLTRAYHGECWIAGPGMPVDIQYWISPDQFILWRLKHV